MSKKVPIEEIKKVFEQHGLILLETKSKGTRYRYKAKDKNGYLYLRSYATVKKSPKKNGFNPVFTFSTKNPYFYENMLLYIKNNVFSKTVLLTKKEDIKNIDQHLSFKCGLCGEEYKSTWHTFISNKDKICNFCFNRKRSLKLTNTKHKDTNKFHVVAQKNGLIILNGPDIKYHQKVLVQNTEGFRGYMTPENILKGASFEKFSIRNPYTIDNLRILAFNNKWDCVIYDQEYKGDKQPFVVMCSCGKDFEVDAVHFVGGKFQCNECRVKQSYISKQVENYLKDKKVNYVKEKTFVDCKKVGLLPFDFWLPEYNVLIEVDGLGHYRPVLFSGDKEKAEQNFTKTKENDEIKTNYCKEHHIPLLRLPFWIIEKNQHVQILDNFLKPFIESNELNN